MRSGAGEVSKTLLERGRSRFRARAATDTGVSCERPTALRVMAVREVRERRADSKSVIRQPPSSHALLETHCQTGLRETFPWVEDGRNAPTRGPNNPDNQRGG